MSMKTKINSFKTRKETSVIKMNPIEKKLEKKRCGSRNIGYQEIEEKLDTKR